MFKETENDYISHTTYYDNGKIKYFWTFHNYSSDIKTAWHNIYGPVFTSYTEDGMIKKEEYWLNDKRLTKEEWEEQRYSNLFNNALKEIL